MYNFIFSTCENICVFIESRRVLPYFVDLEVYGKKKKR